MGWLLRIVNSVRHIDPQTEAEVWEIGAETMPQPSQSLVMVAVIIMWFRAKIGVVFLVIDTFIQLFGQIVQRHYVD